MSTYFYLECLSHTPPLQCDTEVSQHDDRYVEAAIRLAQGEPATSFTEDDFLGSWTREGALRFLREHEHCAIDIVSEYGDRRPIPGRGIHRDRAVLEQQQLEAVRARMAALDALRAADEAITITRGQLHALDAREGS